MKLLHLLARYAKVHVQGSIAEAVAPVGPYVRQLSIGAGLTLVGALCFGLTVLFLSVSLFFVLADLGQLGTAGLWTALVVALFGGILCALGLSFLGRTYKG